MTASSASMGTSSSTTTRPDTRRRTASASARSRTVQTALAVVAPAGGLQHDRPPVGGGEGGNGVRGMLPRFHHGEGRDGHAAAVEDGTHATLVHGELERRRHRAGAPRRRASSARTTSRSTCSWSNVTTAQRAVKARRSSATKGDPSTTSAATATGSVVGAFGQHGHGEAERAGRLARHAGQLARPDEPDVVGPQLTRPRPGNRLDRGADTLGRLREGAPGTWQRHCASGA